MDTDISKVVPLLTSITAVLGGILGILKHFQYKTRRDEIMLVRQAFEGVSKSLASNVEIERMAGAILLRRFFDPGTEVGISAYWKEAVVRIQSYFGRQHKVDNVHSPFCKEAVYVAAAILREQGTGN